MSGIFTVIDLPRVYKTLKIVNADTLSKLGSIINATPATIYPNINGIFLPKVSIIGPKIIAYTILANSAILLALPNTSATSF